MQGQAYRVPSLLIKLNQDNALTLSRRYMVSLTDYKLKMLTDNASTIYPYWYPNIVAPLSESSFFGPAAEDSVGFASFPAETPVVLLLPTSDMLDLVVVEGSVVLELAVVGLSSGFGHTLPSSEAEHVNPRYCSNSLSSLSAYFKDAYLAPRAAQLIFPVETIRRNMADSSLGRSML